MQTLKVKLLSETSKLPTKAYDNDAGIDIYANEKIELGTSFITEYQTRKINHTKIDKEYITSAMYPIKPKRQIIKTGISVDIPEGYCLIIKDRSGLAAKKGLTILAGVIDCGYKDEIGVVVLNTSNQNISINSGDKIAQMLLLPVPEVNIVEVDKLENSERGKKGFGSSGVC